MFLKQIYHILLSGLFLVLSLEEYHSYHLGGSGDLHIHILSMIASDPITILSSVIPLPSLAISNTATMLHILCSISVHE